MRTQMLWAAGGLFVTTVMLKILDNKTSLIIPGNIEPMRVEIMEKSFKQFSDDPVDRSGNLSELSEVAGEVVVKITKYPIRSDYQKSFRKVLSAYVSSSLGAKDNIMSEAYYERESPNTLWVIERWSSQASLNANNQLQQAKAIQTTVIQAASSPVETIIVRDLEPLSKETWRREPNPGDHPFTIMLFVDAKNGTQDNFKGIYHKAMPQIRGESGIVTYQLSQRMDDDTKFITYEKFRNQDAFQYHLKFAPLKPILDYLHNSIKSPPFEKGLHNLIQIGQ